MNLIFLILPKMSAIGFSIFHLILLLLNATNATRYTCGGQDLDKDDTNKCQDMRRQKVGQPQLRDMKCITHPEMGCEQYKSFTGAAEFYCCPQHCDDQPTPQTSTQIDLSSTRADLCTAGVCRSDRTKVCKHVSTGQEYCCPQPHPSQINAQPSGGTGTGGTGTGGTGAGTGTGTGGNVYCEDNRSDCAANADMCIVASAYEKMYVDCPKTCNVCTGQCMDMGTDCPAREQAGYCGRAMYKDLMNWQCPKSCGTCNNRPPPQGNPMSVRGRR